MYMRKLFSKKLSAALVCLILLVTTSTAMAAVPPDNSISPQASYYLSSYLAYVYSAGGGKVEVCFDVTGTTKMDKIGATTIVLKESSDNKSWTTVKTFRYASYPSMMGSNDVTHTSSVSYSGVAGRYYKATVTVYAAKDGGSDSRLVSTSTIKAPKP